MMGLLLSLLVQPASDEPAPSPSPPPARIDIGALPIVNFNSDLGVGMGASVALFFRSPDRQPYRYALSGQAFVTTGGFQRHFFRFDAPDFAGSGFRPIATAGYLRDLYRPWYGTGNATMAPPQSDPAFRQHLYAFDLEQVFLHLVLDRQIAGPLRAALLYTARSLSTHAYTGSLFAAERPLGAAGGAVGVAGLELVLDTRDEEASPTRGWYLTLAGRLAHAATGSSYSFYGGTAIARAYASPIGPRLVLAGRLALDALGGDVPVDELVLFGGRERIEGLGGVWSLRGLPRFRYVGDVKALANLEVRSRLLRMYPRGRHSLDLWLLGFVDSGRIWAARVDDGPTWNLHTGAGGGLRVAWERDYVVRIDAGFAEGEHAVYLDFNQMF